MKRYIVAIIMLCIIAVEAIAYPYPATLADTMQQFKLEVAILTVVTIAETYVGLVIFAGRDYMVLKSESIGVVIIPYSAICEVSMN